jgi:hypothetical protein
MALLPVEGETLLELQVVSLCGEGRGKNENRQKNRNTD